MSSTTVGWAQLRQQARTLETQTDTLFHKYSQFSSTTLIPPTPSEEEQQTEAEISDLLTRRESLISQLSRLLDSELNQSALKQNNLARHREILAEHRKDFQKLKNNIKEARDKANLLGTVRADIEQYRQSNPAQAEAEYMLDERGRIDNSHNIADSVLSQAYAVNESFGLQRETLANINRRIVGAASQVPGINSLIGRISAKKRRDGIILAVFIAFCFLMLLYFR
jgi:golgi SNAP receptor complex member 1